MQLFEDYAIVFEIPSLHLLMVYAMAAVAAVSVPGKEGFCRYEQFWVTAVLSVIRKTQQIPKLKNQTSYIVLHQNTVGYARTDSTLTLRRTLLERCHPYLDTLSW